MNYIASKLLHHVCVRKAVLLFYVTVNCIIMVAGNKVAKTF